MSDLYGVERLPLPRAGEMAEIVYLGVVEWKLDLSEVFDNDRAGQEFMGVTVRPLSTVNRQLRRRADPQNCATSTVNAEAIIICTYDTKHPMTERYLPPGVEPNDRMHWVF